MLSATEPCLSSPAFQDLIAAARAGSAEARGLAIQACWNYLISVAQRELSTELQHRAGASDLVQETFLHADQLFDQFQGRDHRQLQAWIRQILLYRISRFRRGQRAQIRSHVREVRIDDTHTPPVYLSQATELSSCTKLIREEQLARLRCAIKALKPRHRDLIILRGLEQRSFEEIAVRQGRTPAAVAKAWVRAADRLCEEYNRLGGTATSIAEIL
jgi:RNA polymerase sigma-70 factor (ECF subfamily)